MIRQFSLRALVIAVIVVVAVFVYRAVSVVAGRALHLFMPAIESAVDN